MDLTKPCNDALPPTKYLKRTTQKYFTTTHSHLSYPSNHSQRPTATQRILTSTHNHQYYPEKSQKCQQSSTTLIKLSTETQNHPEKPQNVKISTTTYCYPENSQNNTEPRTVHQTIHNNPLPPRKISEPPITTIKTFTTDHNHPEISHNNPQTATTTQQHHQTIHIDLLPPKKSQNHRQPPTINITPSTTTHYQKNLTTSQNRPLPPSLLSNEVIENPVIHNYLLPPSNHPQQPTNKNPTIPPIKIP